MELWNNGKGLIFPDPFVLQYPVFPIFQYSGSFWKRDEGH